MKLSPESIRALEREVVSMRMWAYGCRINGDAEKSAEYQFRHDAIAADLVMLTSKLEPVTRTVESCRDPVPTDIAVSLHD